MLSKDYHTPKLESAKAPSTKDRLLRDGGRGDRKIDSFYQLKAGENKLSDKEIIAESGSLLELEKRLMNL